MTPFVVAGVFVLLAAAALLAWRWWLADRTAQRAHELELHTRHVTVEQAALDEDRAKVRNLEKRVKDLEYRLPNPKA